MEQCNDLDLLGSHCRQSIREPMLRCKVNEGRRNCVSSFQVEQTADRHGLAARKFLIRGRITPSVI